ncbi:MAG: peptidoglycan DD-metalloendopeptidase family protein [Oscillospiraceae bacterium]|nr:peptidoglycan DD-metalloendopeptidase family protein [Oscillospiraceae bacterium]
MEKKLTRILAVVLVMLMMATAAVPSFVSADAREDYEAAQAELDRIEKELGNIKDTKKKQQEEKANTQTQINLVKNQLSYLSAQIEETTAALAEKQAELDEKKVEIYETDELFKSKLKAMYIRRSGNMIATALAVDTFSEMLTAVNTLSSISQADTALLQQLDKEKKEIEAVEAEIEAQLESLEASRERQQDKQSELANLLQKVNSDLSQTEAEEAAAQAAYEDAKEARDAAQEQLAKEFEESGGMEDYVGGEWMWPVPGYNSISSGYGYRNIFGYREFHTGIDIPAGYGTPIKASNSGIVTVAAYQSTGYGNRIIVDHGGGYKSLYAHCSSLAVKVGDYVAQGDTIAYVGSTGLSTGNHLHFEIRINDQYTDPTPYVR